MCGVNVQAEVTYTYTSADFFFFFFNAPSTTEIYTLSLHDALPISVPDERARGRGDPGIPHVHGQSHGRRQAAGSEVDRKSTRLNSSHITISYAVFCLKKKKK